MKTRRESLLNSSKSREIDNILGNITEVQRDTKLSKNTGLSPSGSPTTTQTRETLIAAQKEKFAVGKKINKNTLKESLLQQSASLPALVPADKDGGGAGVGGFVSGGSDQKLPTIKKVRRRSSFGDSSVASGLRQGLSELADYAQKEALAESEGGMTDSPFNSPGGLSRGLSNKQRRKQKSRNTVGPGTNVDVQFHRVPTLDELKSNSRRRTERTSMAQKRRNEIEQGKRDEVLKNIEKKELNRQAMAKMKETQAYQKKVSAGLMRV